LASDLSALVFALDPKPRTMKVRVVDPDPDWIWIRIGNPDPGARKLRNFSGKMHFLVIFKKNFTIKKV
jgi:hypothetical protein